MIKLQMSYYPEPDSHLRVQVVLCLWNYAIKKELNNATDIDTSNLATKTDFIVLEAKVNKLAFVNWLMFQLVWIVWKQK